MTDASHAWTLRGRLGRLFLAIGALITVLAVVCTVAIVRFADTADDVIDRYQPAQLASQRLLTDLVDQETGIRGYLITHRPESLEPYVTYRPQQDLDARAVRTYVGAEARFARLLDRFVASATTWQRDFAEPTIRNEQAGRGNPATLDAGKAVFDELRRRAEALISALRVQVKQALNDRRSAGYFAVAALIVVLLVIVASGVAIWVGLRRWVVRPMGRLGGQTRVVASGDMHREIVADGPGELLDLGADVESMRRQIAAELTRAETIAAELGRSNADLQQFAYVASHDLSEPLRKVSNFCQLIERQYGPQLDDRARQYIWFAVDGAKRMQTLINDLLALSRVGRSTESFVEIELDRALDQALANLSERIATAHARIERPPALPSVFGDRSLLTSLLENLVGNAVKYRREDEPPVVAISVEAGEEGWLFTVRDNGIGIEAQYAERIFAVFQRLHLRDQYGGTGIGLALCRRIVDFHGGRIWFDPVQSEPGSTFRFLLPFHQSEGHPRAEPSR